MGRAEKILTVVGIRCLHPVFILTKNAFTALCYWCRQGLKKKAGGEARGGHSAWPSRHAQT